MTSKPLVMMPAARAAVREGRKTVTRRLINSLKNWDHDFEPEPYFITQWGIWAIEHPYSDGSIILITNTKPGEIYYLTETYWAFGHWEYVQKKGRMGWAFVCDRPDDIRFVAPNCALPSMDKANPGIAAWYKRNAHFMPRAYARTFIRVTGVGVERLRDISEVDAIKEGCRPYWDAENPEQVRSPNDGFIEMLPLCGPLDAFQALWNSLHPGAHENWQANPWVAVVDFERVEP